MEKNLKKILLKQKILVIGIIMLLTLFLSNYYVFAEQNELEVIMFESLLSTNVGTKETENKGNLTYATDVTPEMCTPSYWNNRAKKSSEVLMTPDEIQELNQEIINGSGTNVFDLEKISSPLLVGFEKFIKNGQNRDVYINGSLINQDDYIAKYQTAQESSVYFDGTARGEKIYYAVATKRADLKAWPTDEILRL